MVPSKGTKRALGIPAASFCPKADGTMASPRRWMTRVGALTSGRRSPTSIFKPCASISAATSPLLDALITSDIRRATSGCCSLSDISEKTCEASSQLLRQSSMSGLSRSKGITSALALNVPYRMSCLTCR